MRLMLNATNRKKLANVLRQTGRTKITEEQLEAAAHSLIEGKKTRFELAEALGVSVQTLSKRLHKLVVPPEELAAE